MMRSFKGRNALLGLTLIAIFLAGSALGEDKTKASWRFEIPTHGLDPDDVYFNASLWLANKMQRGDEFVIQDPERGVLAGAWSEEQIMLGERFPGNTIHFVIETASDPVVFRIPRATRGDGLPIAPCCVSKRWLAKKWPAELQRLADELAVALRR